MTDYVQYHKVEERGDRSTLTEPKIYTKKSKKYAEDAEGSRVWLIAGQGSPRHYYLYYAIRAEFVIPSDDPDFEHKILGDWLHYPKEPIILNPKPWFDEFLAVVKRFEKGFSPIPDYLAKELEALVV